MEERKLTGYPSIDKPWLKYYSEEAINAPLPEGTVYEYILDQNKENLSAYALNYFGNKITYEELFNRIDITASKFHTLGISRGDIVMLFALNTPESVYSIYALNKLGAIVDLEYVNMDATAIRDKISKIAPKYIIAIDTMVSKLTKAIDNNLSGKTIALSAYTSLPTLKKTLLTIKGLNTRLKGLNCKYIDDIPPGNTDVNILSAVYDTAVIVQTSGTTGSPKSVLLSNYNLNSTAIQYAVNSNLQLNRGDSILNIAPPFYAFGIVLGIHVPLSLGMCVCLAPDPNPDKAHSSFCIYRPNHYLGGPGHLKDIAHNRHLRNANLDFLYTAGCGGESVNAEDAAEINKWLLMHKSKAFVVTGYGMSELGGTFASESKIAHKTGSVGIPLPLSNVCIKNFENNAECGYGEIGEILLSSPGIMAAYYKDADETKNVLFTDNQGKNWIRSGDLGYVDEDGFLFLTGRLKRVFLSRDSTGSIYKLFPAYIESVICKLEKVEACAVIAVKIDEPFYMPLAFVELKQHKTAEVEEIRKFCIEHIAHNMIPNKIVILDSIPRAANGKIDYRALEKEAEETT